LSEKANIQKLGIRFFQLIVLCLNALLDFLKAFETESSRRKLTQIDSGIAPN